MKSVFALMLIAFMAAMFQPVTAGVDNSPPGIMQPVSTISQAGVPVMTCIEFDAYILQQPFAHFETLLLQFGNNSPGYCQEVDPTLSSLPQKAWIPPDIRWSASLNSNTSATAYSFTSKPPGITRIRAVNKGYLDQREMYVFRT